MAEKKKKVPVVPARPGTTRNNKMDKTSARKIIKSSSPERIAQMGTKQIVKLYKTAFPKKFEKGLKRGMDYAVRAGGPAKYITRNSDGGPIGKRAIKPEAKWNARELAAGRVDFRKSSKASAYDIGSYRGIQKTKKAVKGKSKNIGGGRLQAK